MRALDRKLWRDLWHTRGQVFAIGVIVACGIGILIMSLGTIDSLDASRAAYYQQNRFADIFAGVKRAPLSLASKIERIDGVNRTQLRIVRSVTLDVPGMTEPAIGHLVSLPQERDLELNTVSVLHGRYPARGRAGEAIVDEAFAQAHGFALGSFVEALINGNKRRVQIVGIGRSPEFIYTLAPGALMPDSRRFAVFWMDRDVLEAAFDLDGAFNDVLLTLLRGANAKDVISELDNVLERYGGFGAYEREDQQSHAFLKGEMDQLATIAGIIPPIFIFVSAFLLHTVLGRLIDVEREQIGLLKAFGYTGADITMHYLKFALVIASVGFLLGSLLGMAMQYMMTGLYTEFFHLPTLAAQPSISAFAIGGAIAFLTAFVGAFSGVRRAARLAPAVAMSPPTPTHYRRGAVNGFDVSRLFDGSTQMILRHTFRWPAKAATTIVGVAAATGLLISTLFTFDSTEVMIDILFEKAGAYDAFIQFAEPQPVRVLREIAYLPGVMATEPARAIPVRFRHGPFTETGSLEGIDDAATMRQVVNADFETTKIAAEGLTLSSQLANKLDVRRGDVVTLEVQEGLRPTREVFVSAISEDLLGAPAYMERLAMNRLMGESELVSGAYVKLDPLQEEAFYEAIKARPLVAGVGLQRIAMRMFRDTIAQSQSIMMMIYQVLSASIAAGVIYNSVRIALSERARELASMRVLGFGRAEVSYILLGQSFLLVLLALPIGCLAGYGIAWLIVSGMQSDLYRIPLVINPSSYGRAIVVVLSASVISAFFVRRRIDALDLIAVLKTRD